MPMTLMLNATNGASANGTDTNLVTATLMSGNAYISGAALDFRIVSGNALFSNGTQQISTSTSALGEATVPITDTVEETVSLLVILSSDATVYQSVSSAFSAGGGSTYTLTLTATSTASSNGVDTNTATATLLNNGLAASNETIRFSIATGNAVFTGNTTTTAAITDALGQTFVSFTDQTAETVTVLASLGKDTTINQTASSTFSPDGKISISRVYNANNKDFDISTGGPHNLFIGASFYIQLSEPSESVLWSCDDKNVEVKNFNGNGIVTIKGTPSSNVISIKFSNGGGASQYDIECDVYLSDVHLTRDSVDEGTTTTINDYRNIYNEWGDMSTFGWGKANSTIYSSIGAYIDMSTGKDTFEQDNLSYSKPEKLV